MIARPVEPPSASGEVREWGELAGLRVETNLSEEGTVIENMRLYEERRWAIEGYKAQVASGDFGLWAASEEWSITSSELRTTMETQEEMAPSEDFSLTSSDLERAAEEQAEEDARIEKRMEEDDRIIAEEEKLRQEAADNYYRRSMVAMIYDQGVLIRCNKMIREAIWKAELKMKEAARRATAVPGKKDNSMMAEFDNTKAGDVEFRNAPTADAAVGVTDAAADGNNKPLPMTGNTPKASAVPEACMSGALDAGAGSRPMRLGPRTKNDRIVSGREDITFTEEVADACKDEPERTREGGKMYRAVKAAMGDRSVGSYQFITDIVGHTITGFISSSMVDVLLPLWQEHKMREIDAIAAIEEAAAEADAAALKVAIQAATKVWVNEFQGDLESHAAFAAACSKSGGAVGGSQASGGTAEGSAEGLNDATALETTLETDASQLPTSGKGRERGRERGRGRGMGRLLGRGITRGQGRGGTGRSQEEPESAVGGATETITGGFSEGPKRSETPELPPAGRSRRSNALRNTRGTRGRESMRRGRGGIATEGFAESSKPAEARVLPRIPPATLDKSLLPDASQLGKRKRESEPKTMESRLESTGDFSTGLKDAAASAPPILETAFGPDVAQVPTRGRVGRRRGRGNKRARQN
ncbi:hypothetical protein V493_01756 [Pseudogymnoascus sp. VKM F-4281 (FW-2241)]|nr:hypothetical protein V493_01756 [Pseudogymnoascus sp. VKM F-4281 (FW-2241)]